MPFYSPEAKTPRRDTPAVASSRRENDHVHFNQYQYRLDAGSEQPLEGAKQPFAELRQRLSSGYRINSASDDAAGLAISDSMTSQIRSYAVASRNTNDGISMAQTADGALSQVTDILGRMSELATQGANGALQSSRPQLHPNGVRCASEGSEAHHDLDQVQWAAAHYSKASSLGVVPSWYQQHRRRSHCCDVRWHAPLVALVSTSTTVSGAATSGAVRDRHD